MKKPKMKNVMKNVQTTFEKKSPEILTGIGVAGMITTTVMAVRATPKAILILNEEECRRSKLEDANINMRDTVKLTWKCYVPSCIIGSVSIACLVGASSVNAKRNAALATAYSISESVLKDYQEKVIEVIGEKKEQGIRDSIAKDKIKKNPVEDTNVIITNKGNTLCYDVISGRYFRFDIDKIKKIENNLYRQLLDERFLSLNDFYFEIGLDNISLGDELGWNIDDGKFGLYFTSQLTHNDEPCLVINYSVAPRSNYYKI